MNLTANQLKQLLDELRAVREAVERLTDLVARQDSARFAVIQRDANSAR